jgi:hypothetical protein
MRRSTALVASALLLLLLAVAFTTAVPHDARSEVLATKVAGRDRRSRTARSRDQEEQRRGMENEEHNKDAFRRKKKSNTVLLQ